MAEVVTRVKLSTKEVTDAIIDKAKASLGGAQVSSSTLEELVLAADGTVKEAIVVFHK